MSMYGPYAGHVVKDQHARIAADVAVSRARRRDPGTTRFVALVRARQVVAGRAARVTTRAARPTALGTEGAG